MLRWAFVLFFVAITAAAFGFGGIASGAAAMAQVLFFLLLAALVIVLVWHVSRRV